MPPEGFRFTLVHPEFGKDPKTGGGWIDEITDGAHWLVAHGYRRGRDARVVPLGGGTGSTTAALSKRVAALDDRLTALKAEVEQTQAAASRIATSLHQLRRRLGVAAPTVPDDEDPPAADPAVKTLARNAERVVTPLAAEIECAQRRFAEDHRLGDCDEQVPAGPLPGELQSDLRLRRLVRTLRLTVQQYAAVVAGTSPLTVAELRGAVAETARRVDREIAVLLGRTPDGPVVDDELASELVSDGVMGRVRALVAISEGSEWA